jgi:hypothetical protein
MLIKLGEHVEKLLGKWENMLDKTVGKLRRQ